MWNARLDEAQAGIKISRRNINNLRYADDTTLMVESKEELKSLLMKVMIEENEKVGLKLNIQETKIMASSPITSWPIDGETMETVTDSIFLGSKFTADGDCSHEIKRHLLLGRKVLTNLNSILKSRDITLLTKVSLIKAMLFPVVMYGCQSWTIWKLSTEKLMLLNFGVGEDSWESLNYKEIQPVHPKGNQSWIFTGSTDAEAETPTLWPSDAKNWLVWKDPDVENWTIKKAKPWRIDFELWCWRRLLRVPWTARWLNQSILKEINPEYSLEELMLKLRLQYFGHLMQRTDSLETTLMLGLFVSFYIFNNSLDVIIILECLQDPAQPSLPDLYNTRSMLSN